jgi:hypothetical protein
VIRVGGFLRSKRHIQAIVHGARNLSLGRVNGDRENSPLLPIIKSIFSITSMTAKNVFFDRFQYNGAIRLKASKLAVQDFNSTTDRLFIKCCIQLKNQ